MCACMCERERWKKRVMEIDPEAGKKMNGGFRTLLGKQFSGTGKVGDSTGKTLASQT